jgi:alpha-2-macroglobulin
MGLMKRNAFHSLMCAWTAAAIVTGGCRTPAGTRVATPTPTADPGTPAATAPAATAAATTTSGRPQIAIDAGASDGKLTVETRDAQVAAAQTTITELTPGEVAALHARLEPLSDLAMQNAGAPTLRAPTPAPARPGPVEPIAFVVPTGKPVSDAPVAPAKWSAPLAAPQITPQGEIRSESEIRVRFSEPMVPVAAVGTAASPVATITPAIAGTWRWIDTRVATFTATPRLPQATELTITVPAGTKAVSGATLMTDASDKLSTAPIAITSGYPTTLLHASSPIVIKLDQDLDPGKLLPFLRVTRAKGGAVLPHKAATLADAQREWAQNPAIAFDPAKADASLGKHYIVLAPQTAWPGDTEIQVTLSPGAPSREGPRVSTRPSFATFKIAPPFKVLGVTCGAMYDDEGPPRMAGAVCPVNGYVRVHFSTPIAIPSYRAQKVQIDGTPFDDNKPNGSHVDLDIPGQVGRAHSITIGPDLVDIYGQRYTGGHKLGFVSGPQRFGAWLHADTGMHVLDPRFEIPQWLVYSSAIASMRVQLFAVSPQDYFAFQQYEAGKRAAPPGRRMFDQTYTVGPHHAVDARVDLRPALNAAGLGHVVAVATAQPLAGAAAAGRAARSRLLNARIAWIQVTKLGVSSRIDGERVNAWVQDITPSDRFLRPVGGATVSLLAERRGESGTGTSDATGHAQVDLFPRPPKKPTAAAAGSGADADDDDDDDEFGDYYDYRPALLHARTATDSTFAVVDRHEKALRVENALWYVTDDRFTYKPGEKVYVKGWVRWTHNGINPDLSLPRAGESVAYSVSDSKGTRIASGDAKFSAQGGFHIEVELPPSINLGTVYFSLATRKQSYRHPIAVQEFRTPAYSVTLDDDIAHSGAIPLVLGEQIEMTATAKYYSGGGLGGAAVQWDATLKTTPYAPPGWNLFTFTPPHGRQHRYYDVDDRSIDARAGSSLSGSSTSTVTYGIAALPGARTSILEVDATVTDVDRTSIRASSRPILVHPSAYYVGLRLRPQTDDALEVIVTDIDGNAAPGVGITVDIEGVLASERYRADAKVIDTQSCKLASVAAPVTCSFRRKDGKTAYMARARIADARGRTNAAQLAIPWWSFDDRDDLQVVPDKASYRPGEVARIDIRSKVFPATAVVSFARRGVISQRPIELAAASTTVELPLAAALIPNVHVTVDRYARRRDTQPGSTLPLPEHTHAEAELRLDLENARLAMQTRATKPLVQPGEEATFEAFVRHDGKPVAGAEVALMVVDEAVLALSGRSHADPLAPFYRHMANGTITNSSLDTVHDSGDDLAGGPGVTRTDLTISTGRWGTIGHGSGSGSGYGGGGGRGGMRGTSDVVSARKDFRANAVFSPVLLTDGSGRVAVTVKMPDSLTRFRVVALATSSGRYFGKAESTIVTQRKINARTVAPRFLTQGDRFSLPIVVQNLDSSPRTVELAVRAANLEGVGPAGKRVTVPAGQRAEVRFDFTTKARGRAIVQTVASSGEFADASNVELPIYEPATTESFATYGVVGAGAAPGAGPATDAQFEQLVVPPSIFTDVGGVEVELASTQLQSLTDAYWYLYRYPYECAEQRSGRMLATAALYDILDAFAVAGRPTRQEIEARRAKDATELGKTQRADGGWGYFGGTTSDPFVTQQVLAALAAQKITGKVTAQAIDFVTRDSSRLLQRLVQAAAKPADQRLDRAEHPYLVSLAAATLTSLGAAATVAGRVAIDVRGRAERLHALATTLGSYPIDAKARVLAILADPRAGDRARPIRGKLLADLISATHETAAAATVTAQYVDAERLLLVSSTKTTALALDAIMREAPGHALVSKLARGVLDGRRYGRWRSTQENLVALQTMRRYFDTYEKVTPSYTGKLWFGSAAYTEHAFAGRTSTRAVARADWSQLQPGSTHDLALVKQGPGRMYYRVGITYAPRQTNLPALDAGFIVRRSYSAEDPADVVKTPDGYKIRLGAKVQVTLELLATTRRHAVALVDQLPAGFESVNTNLATAERALAAPGDARWDHVNMRDNRTEAFQMDLREGTHRFSYTVRAATPGTFIAAPAKAEEMYSPETFGRSSGLKVVIE